MLAHYDAAAWYWTVGNRESLIFCSALPGYLAPGDAGYAAWLAAGNKPTRIASDGELADVLLKAGLANAVVAASGPTSFEGIPTAAGLAVVAAVGAALTSSAMPDLDATYEICGIAWEDMKNEGQYITTFAAFAGGVATLQWIARDKTVTFATTAQFLAVLRGLADYLSGWKMHFATGAAAPALGIVTIA